MSNSIPTGVAYADPDFSSASIKGKMVPSGTKAAAITKPADGATQDAEARAAIDDIIDVLKAFGMIS